MGDGGSLWALIALTLDVGTLRCGMSLNEAALDQEPAHRREGQGAEDGEQSKRD